MKIWWQGLNSRERLLLTAAGGALLLALVYLWGVEPLQLRQTRLQGELQGQTRSLEVLRQLGEEATSLRQGGATRGQLPEGQTLLALLNSAAKAKDIAPAIERIVPNGAGEASLVVRGIPFDTLVGWLIELRTTAGVEASRLVVDAEGSKPGVVNASLTVIANASP